MGISKLKIPKICEFCEKPFEAKTVTTRFCCISCNNKALKKLKKMVKELEANIIGETKSIKKSSYARQHQIGKYCKI